MLPGALLQGFLHARGLHPQTGSGSELYAIIGHAPRHLDRNIAIVGRVIDGIEHLSSLPRGSGTLGFYEANETPTEIDRVIRGAVEMFMARYGVRG